MIFNSLTFVVFLFIFTIGYWTSRHNVKLWLIFLASITFYGFWKVEFLSLLLFSTTVDFFVAKNMLGASKRAKNLLLSISLICNIGLLLFFKYLYFIHENISLAFSFFGVDIPPINLNIILPLGISFYTFQTISYTVDVYRGHLTPEKNFLPYACYVMFFPQLIAGPVLRASEVLPQLKEKKTFSNENLALGLRRIIYGLFLKVVIADNIAPFVDEGFLINPDLLSALDVWTLAFLFGFQIYFDFSAYSHIAIGTAKILGINFPENFNFPYSARNPREFWKRWHISLSSWIRDYLYLPLIGAKVLSGSKGGLGEQVQRADNSKADRGLFISWGIMGLWHGANWTFLIWGIYHATVIYIYRKLSNTILGRIPSVISVMATLGVMMLSWIPFRAESISQTLQLWSHVINPMHYNLPLGLRENSYIVALILLISFFLSYACRNKLLYVNTIKFSYLHSFVEVCFFSILILLVVIFLRPVSQFIYFQF